MSNTEITDEVLEDISRGEFSDRITALYFWDMRSSFVIPMILAFPNLQTLVVHNLTASLTEPPSVHPVQSQWRTLDSLQVAWCTSGAVEALENLRLTASRLILDVQTENVQKLLIISSLTVVELVLLDSLRKTTSHLIDLPPFPVLTSLKILITALEPSPHLINTLSPISSAPALESVELECLRQKLLSSNTWGDLDGWLSRTAKNARIEGGLVLTLKDWQENRLPEAFLPRFRKVGNINTGSLKVDTL